MIGVAWVITDFPTSNKATNFDRNLYFVQIPAHA